MHVVLAIIGLLLIVATLADGYETILLPRRINNRYRYSRFYYRFAWKICLGVSCKLFKGRVREAALGTFGPLSLIGLFASWVICLILGFAMLQWGLGAPLAIGPQAPAHGSFPASLYFSGTTYFTLGLGDVLPGGHLTRVLTVIEAGLGFGFLAVIISYLPILYQAFSTREATISLLDARAGSPPTAGEFLRRLSHDGSLEIDDATLREWERWCAQLLESYLSFSVLAYYRSQHSNQSWLGALTTMLDSCSLLLATQPVGQLHDAQLTFAMARHAAVDIALIFGARPPEVRDRGPEDESRLDALLAQIGGKNLLQTKLKLRELRGLYEPFLQALSKHFLLTLPPLLAPEPIADNWQRSAWMPHSPGLKSLGANADADHF